VGGGTLSSWINDAQLFSGRLDRDRLERILAALVPVQTVDEWYLCGPSVLVGGARALLADLGVDPPHVHHEEFDVDEEPDYEV
jgi:ring-1,2-phenylacetyl-CoA epoxidase subunit PaaE